MDRLNKEAKADKILVLGIDGWDPRLTRRFIDEGKMPNMKQFLERGSAREDLVLLGGHPTVTPPMWTTLATGAYAYTHGITSYYRKSEVNIDTMEYNLDSRLCKAEQLWNVFAEAGKKTLVWHWPGSSWPPSSGSPYLSVVDGTQPSGVNQGVATVDSDVILVGSVKTEALAYHCKATSDGYVPCVNTDLVIEEREYSITNGVGQSAIKNIITKMSEGEHQMADAPFDVELSPIRPAQGWESAPKDANEFIVLMSGGLVRRPALILKNDEGVFDRVAIYKSKKQLEPMVVLKKNEFVRDILDDAIKDDKTYTVNRQLRLLELESDGDYVKMWISGALDISNDVLWHPQNLYKIVTENVGYPQPLCLLGGMNEQLIVDCMGASWTAAADWTADSINYLIANQGYEIVFSHYHNIDLEGHMIIRNMKKGTAKLPGSAYERFMENVYVQTDYYVGKYLHLLDEGWTIFIVSDHAQVCPEHEPPLIGDPSGTSVGLLRDLGWATLIKDENGNDTRELDWSKTKAVAQRGPHIYLNIKGRDPYGIIEPEDQYEEEEKLMTALYNYKDPETGNRVIGLALRNKDAILLGLGGPESGDIIAFIAEGYNYDHCDSIATTFGYGGTSVSPAFIAAGKGIKAGYLTDRVIRQVDLTPTMAVLGGVRMPAQCEGAPIYQILSEAY